MNMSGHPFIFTMTTEPLQVSSW